MRMHIALRLISKAFRLGVKHPKIGKIYLRLGYFVWYGRWPSSQEWR